MSVHQHDATVLFGPNCLLGFVAGMVHDVCKDCEKHAVTVMVCKAAARFWALTAAQIWIRNGCRTWTSTLVGSLQVPMLLVMLLVLQQSQTPRQAPAPSASDCLACTLAC